MGILQRFSGWVKRTFNDPYTSFLKGLSFTGVGRTPVTEKTSLGLAAYWAGVRRISESIAQLPIDVYKREGEYRIPVVHPSEYLLNAEANYISTAYDFIQVLVASAINHGNGLALIERNGFSTPTALVNVVRENCEPIKFEGVLFWKVYIDGDKTKEPLLVKDADVINLRGFGTDPVLGLSAIRYHQKNLGLALSAQDYGVDFYNKGSRLDGFLEYQGTLSPEAKDTIQDQWNSNYGPNGKAGTAILDNGTKYHRLGMPPEEAQFIQTRKFQKNEIATILGLPPYMIGDFENAKWNNIEQLSIDFTTYSIGSWIEKLEQEFRRKLLKESEKKNHYFKYNTNALLRTDAKSKAELYRTMTAIGVYSINDVRKLEDLNPVENGDERFVQINQAPIGQLADYHKKEENDGE